MGGGENVPYGPTFNATYEMRYTGLVSRFEYLDKLGEEYDRLILNGLKGSYWPKDPN